MAETDLIRRSEVIEAIDNIEWYHQDSNNDMVSGASNEHEAWYKAEDIYRALETVPSVQPERMTNRQWIDFLSAQFDISRTSAKEMLHGMMQWKKEDNFKKMFNGGQDASTVLPR